MHSEIILTLADNIHIVVPNSINFLTTYVLCEQGDWFEDEIKFLRHLLLPGQRIIDVGANYGVYTLSMAKLVGTNGRVWAFEPTSTTAKFLSKSISVNGFSQVELEQKALSNVIGIAQLSLRPNSEMNALVHDERQFGDTETVSLTTLDECMAIHHWKKIEFLKLDAEGEEKNILQGGIRFFTKQSPLVQYEIKAENALNLKLIQSFAELGYDSYRLVPGLNILVPFSENDLDNFMLNLFCCKPDCASRLSSRGLLVELPVVNHKKELQQYIHYKNLDNSEADSWFNTLSKLPYAQMCEHDWKRMIASGLRSEVDAALSHYVNSRKTSLNAAERFSALRKSYLLFKSLCEIQPSYLRLASLARVARDYGARTQAVNALNQLCNKIFMEHQVNTNEPFLAPGERFDSVPPRNSVVEWVGAAALEELERNAAFSSFYTGVSTQQRLATICELGYENDEMKRRLKLVQMRANMPNIKAGK